MRSKVHIYRSTSVATVFVLTFCSCQVHSLYVVEAPPTRPLAAEKLHPLGNSGVWLCEDERQLRQDLVSLPVLRKTIEGLQKGLSVIVMANAKRWATRNSAADASSAATAAESKSGPLGNAASRGVAELVVDPAKIGDVPAVRHDVIRLTNVRIQLALTLSRIRRTSSQMVTTYDRLANDRSVQAALAEMGANQRLGPAGEYELELQRLRDYFPFVETPWVPAYLQGQHLRFTGICNEHAPVTFTWTSDLTHALITTGSFQAAGLQLPKRASRFDSKPWDPQCTSIVFGFLTCSLAVACCAKCGPIYCRRNTSFWGIELVEVLLKATR